MKKIHKRNHKLNKKQKETVNRLGATSSITTSTKWRNNDQQLVGFVTTASLDAGFVIVGQVASDLFHFFQQSGYPFGG
jgi:hypothetical protein